MLGVVDGVDDARVATGVPVSVGVFDASKTDWSEMRARRLVRATPCGESIERSVLIRRGS
jgi:hypothetical protein